MLTRGARIVLASIVTTASMLSCTPTRVNVAQKTTVNETERPADAVRSFYLGFTDFPYAETVEAMDDLYEKIHQHGEIIAFHWDNGIPWPEAYDKRPYHANLEQEISNHLARVRDGQKVYVRIAPMSTDRDGSLSSYWGSEAGQPLPSPWDTYKLSDPQVVEAYSNHCIYMIKRYKPFAFNYAIECTDMMWNKPEAWPVFVEFAKQVYARIKAEYPDLTAGVSGGLRPTSDPVWAKIVSGFHDLHSYADHFDFSVYPYLPPWVPTGGDANPELLPEDWLSACLEAARGKPIAVEESGYITEDLKIPIWYIDSHGTMEWQTRFVEKLLHEAHDLNMMWIVWWCVADFDQIHETWPSELQMLGGIWRDIGLYDGYAKPRPSLEVWEWWRAKPVVPGSGGSKLNR